MLLNFFLFGIISTHSVYKVTLNDVYTLNTERKMTKSLLFDRVIFTDYEYIHVFSLSARELLLVLMATYCGTISGRVGSLLTKIEKYMKKYQN